MPDGPGPVGDDTVSVTLSVAAGDLIPPTLTFYERTTCIIGRAADCSPRIPEGPANRMVSRHHCLLDINPPAIRIRDFGSLNGTYLNGRKIGQREPGQSPEQAADGRYAEHDLSDGDQIRLGSSTIRVSVRVPERGGTPRPGHCPNCGKRVGDGLEGRLCAVCADDPAAVAHGLLELAQAGNPDLDEFAGYVLAHELGRGGMGAVYLLHHQTTGEQIALKLMLPRIAVRPSEQARFMREVTLSRSLRHPNIVTTYGAYNAIGAFCFTSEYCAGGSLADLLDASGGRIPANQAVRLAVQILNGLAHAHRHGVVHRDLSPHNVLLSSDSDGAMVAKIADFGLAKAFDQAGLSGLTRTGVTAGKPAYLPRQQVINFREATPAVDVWAAAACLYRMLTGVLPRDFPAGRDPWQAVLQDPAVPVRRRDPSIPRDLAEVIDRALRDNPEIGIQHATELRDILQTHLPATPRGER
jgi:hypothetical protein